ncbi:hypothetical protein [Paracoccus sp. SY]|uniref:hypothetical protein n=1 Tax=Paracoccus sp. SY TaxID=1330255 RepID=UPI0011AF36C3|nr:hypothetical protein [Paracoccus sp. SY]
MTTAAKLVLIADASSLKQGENALDSLARTGGRVEGKLTVDMKSIEKAMASLGGVMGNLDKTMQAVERAVTGSMSRAQQETTKSARTFDDLRRAIDPAYAASQRFAEVQGELASMVASGAANQEQANQVLEIARSRYLGVATAAEQAEQAQRQQAQAVAMATSNYQSLRASLDPIYASSKRYEAAIETADAALKAKIITEAEHARVMKMAEAQMLSLAPATEAIAPAAQKAGDATSKFGMVANQIGFQLQDVFVSAPMIGWFRAVAQQAPQVAGAFAMLGGSLGTIIPWMGTAIAVGAAILPMFMNAAEASNAAEDAVSDLSDAMSRYKAASEGAARPTAELAAQFGINTEAARRLYEVMADLAQLDLAQSMSGAVSAASAQLEGLNEQVQKVAYSATLMNGILRPEGISIFKDAMAKLRSEYGLTVGQAESLNAALQRLQNAKGVRDQAVAAADFVRVLRDAQAAGATIPPELAATARQMAQAAQLGLELSGTMDSSADSAAAISAASFGIPPILSEAALEAMKLAQNLGLAMGQLSAVIAGIQTAQRTAQNIARINLETVGDPVARAGAIAEYKLLEESGTAAYAAIRSGSTAALQDIKRSTDAVAEGARVTATMEIKASDADKAYAKLAAAAGKAGKAGKKGASDAAKEAERLTKELDKGAERWRDMLDPMNKYRRKMGELAQLTGRLSKDEMAEAQKRLNVELADSLPLAGEFVDIMSNGLLDGFKGTLSNVMGMFKKWLAEMIATAWKNRIVVGMGVSGGGVAGAAAGSVPGVPGIGGAGGVLGGAMSGLGALGGGILSGASGFLSAAMGGLGSAATYTGFMLKGATAGLAGLGSAIGAIALPVAAVAAVFSFFKKKTKELDAGIRVTVKGMDTLVEEFRKTETKRFWGLSKKTRTSYDEADRETSDAISRVVGTLQAGVMEAAKVLGFGSATFRNFAHEMKVSTKGMSEDDALKAVQEAIAGLGDDFAGMVPGLNRMRKDGEGASDALLRLSQSLVTVNGIMDTLGHRFRAAGLSGADAASMIADAFGGLDAMAQATQRFYEAFYSDAERLATTTRQTAKAMADLGIAMPKTRNEYRAIIASLDLTTEKGRKTYAAMIGMADAFDLILPQIGSFTKEMEKLQGRVTTALESVIDKLSNAIKWNAAAAADWRKAGTSIREYLDKLRGTASALFSPQQALAYNRAVYQRTLGQAMSGNVEAAQALPGAAQTYLGSVQDTARSRVDAALAQARVAAALGKVATKTDTTATALEKVAELQQQQLDLLTAARDHIAAGNALTKEGITKLLGQLGGLDAKIALRANDAGTIVAGFNEGLKGTKVQANVSATVSGIAKITGAEGLQGAMGTLRGALVDLRAAIAAETKRQQDAVKKANEVINKPPVAPKPAPPVTPAPVKPQTYTLADYKLVGGYGLGGSEGNGYSYTIRGPLGGVRTFRDAMGTIGWQDWIKGQNFPAFATGGTHRGGPAYVGEKDLELVAPSRIYSPRETKAMLDNREVVAELKSMRSEMSELRAHARRTAESVVQTEKTLKRVDAVGVKIDPDQNAVAGIVVNTPGSGSGEGVDTDYVAIFEAARNG